MARTTSSDFVAHTDRACRLRRRHRTRGSRRHRCRAADPQPPGSRGARAHQGRAPPGIRRQYGRETGASSTACWPACSPRPATAISISAAWRRRSSISATSGWVVVEAEQDPARADPRTYSRDRPRHRAAAARSGGRRREPADEPAGTSDGARRGRPGPRHHARERRLEIRRLRGAPAGRGPTGRR